MQHSGDVIMAMPLITSLRNNGVPVKLALGKQYRAFLEPFNLEYVERANGGIPMHTHGIDIQVTEHWIEKFGFDPVKETIETSDSESYFILSPDSTESSKRMPLEFWKDIVEVYSDENIIIIGPKSAIDYNRRLNETLGVEDYTGKHTIPETYALVKNAKAVVTTDTGMSHLSDYLNNVTITAFNKKNYHKFKPYWNPRVCCDSKHALLYLNEMGINTSNNKV